MVCRTPSLLLFAGALGCIGPVGPRGPQGEPGEAGQAGVDGSCEPEALRWSMLFSTCMASNGQQGRFSLFVDTTAADLGGDTGGRCAYDPGTPGAACCALSTDHVAEVTWAYRLSMIDVSTAGMADQRILGGLFPLNSTTDADGTAYATMTDLYVCCAE